MTGRKVDSFIFRYSFGRGLDLIRLEVYSKPEKFLGVEFWLARRSRTDCDERCGRRIVKGAPHSSYIGSPRLPML